MQTMIGLRRDAMNQYREQSVLTASPGDLVVMLYDGCIKKVKLARLAIHENDNEQSCKHLLKSQEFIDELIKGLDFNYSLSNDLLKLYDFMMMELIQCNITKDAQRLLAVEQLLEEMKITWQQAVQQCRMQQQVSLERC